MAHVHAKLIQQFAKDAMEYDDPGKLWEVYYDCGDNWNSFSPHNNPGFNDAYLYRRKQETININGHNVPKPLKIDDIEGSNMIYYVPSFSYITNYIELSDKSSDIRYFAKKGLLHKTKEAAIAHARALISFTEQKND